MNIKPHLDLPSLKEKNKKMLIVTDIWFFSQSKINFITNVRFGPINNPWFFESLYIQVRIYL